MLFGSLPTVAVNCAVVFPGTFVGVEEGWMLTVIAGTVIVATAVFVGSVADAAVSVTSRSLAGAAAGAA